MSRALVIAAHGSRRDPAANARVRKLAHTIRARRLFDEVAVAFHQGEPRFDTVLDELTADEVTVVPLLTSAGHYTDVVLPTALSKNRRIDLVRLQLTPPVGTHGGIPGLVARQVAELLRQRPLPRRAVSLAIVGHGTPRHRESRTSTIQLADTLRRRRVAGEVLAAFIDDEPPLADLVQRASLPHLVVVPFLIGGEHVSRDIPRLLQPEGKGKPVVLADPVGSYPGLADIVVDLARRHGPPPAQRLLGHPAPRIRPGSVHLVGGGPGDPGLITSRGLELLRLADVVVHDLLIGPGLLCEARAGALLVDVGKSPGHTAYSQREINALLVKHARLGRTVVRLKGGDPFVFGRGSEEVAACRAAEVEVHVVPGVSSAIAAPAAAGIPVTARGVAHSFTVMTGHLAGASEDSADLPVLPVLPSDTLVLLMARSSLRAIAEQLIAAGRDPATPAACIQSATTPAQRVTRATLGTIADAADRDGLESPVVTVIGQVAALGRTAEVTEKDCRTIPIALVGT